MDVDEGKGRMLAADDVEGAVATDGEISSGKENTRDSNLNVEKNEPTSTHKRTREQILADPPQKPKKPSSGYMAFAAHLRKSNPGKKVTVQEVGAAWKKMSENEKEKFNPSAEALAEYQNQLNEYRRYQEVLADDGQPKPPVRPKKPKSAYMAFGVEFREKNSGKKITVQQVGEAWNKLTDEEKQGYNPSALDLVEYRENMKKFQEDMRRYKEQVENVGKPKPPSKPKASMKKSAKSLFHETLENASSQDVLVQWKALASSEKDRFRQLAKESAVKYDKAMQEYESKLAKYKKECSEFESKKVIPDIYTDKRPPPALPFSNVSKIMKKSSEQKLKVEKRAVSDVLLSTEMFLEQMITDTLRHLGNRKTISYEMVRASVMSGRRYEFLNEDFPANPKRRKTQEVEEDSQDEGSDDQAQRTKLTKKQREDEMDKRVENHLKEKGGLRFRQSNLTNLFVKRTTA